MKERKAKGEEGNGDFSHPIFRQDATESTLHDWIVL